jgi:HEPN domain-containing protein
MNMAPDIEKNQRILKAKSWLNRAKKDCRGYAKVVGRQFIYSKKDLAEDPALAIYLLQQASEKAVKAIAVASGDFEESELFTHNSLKLLLDLIQKWLEIPAVRPTLNLLKSFYTQPASDYLDIDKILEKISTTKENIDKDRPPDVPDWVSGFALLPPNQVRGVVNMLITLRPKMESEIFHLLRPEIMVDTSKIKEYVNQPTASSLQAMLAPAFRGDNINSDALSYIEKVIPIFTGKSLQQQLIEALGNEPINLQSPRRKIGKRSYFEKSALSTWSMGTLLFLAAFTFAHESWTRYPNTINSKLDCDSYTENLGIVSCLRELGQLTRDSIYGIEDSLDSISSFFAKLRK